MMLMRFLTLLVVLVTVVSGSGERRKDREERFTLFLKRNAEAYVPEEVLPVEGEEPFARIARRFPKITGF
ncbi:hypothetical protein Ciccas_010495 [Cichlidogyrus casuarinus]|uniref:Uncharacterized protein n=1 Tax=Cichlidogyrus casuarinus TaxID=1844966 RepID=A0ABD2PUS9_9PLAT